EALPRALGRLVEAPLQVEEDGPLVEVEARGVRVRPLDHIRRAPGEDVAEAAAHLAGSQVADRVVRLVRLLEGSFESELVARRDEKRLAAALVAQDCGQPREEAMNSRRLAVALDERVQRVV